MRCKTVKAIINKKSPTSVGLKALSFVGSYNPQKNLQDYMLRGVHGLSYTGFSIK